jgi:FMN phosphatase YigB (HAD superfamily)
VIRGIAFDLFDTLVDQNHERFAPVEFEGRRVGATTPALHAATFEDASDAMSVVEFAELLRTVDRELRAETLDLGLELSTLDRFAALATRVGSANVMEVARRLTDVHMGMLRNAVSVPSHHESVLITLAVDYRLALCSNFSHAPTARAILAESGFDEHLTSVIVSDEIGIRKPRREIFEAVANSLDCAPDEILHVGDSLHADVAGAAEFGMRTVWLTRRVRDPEAELARFEGPRPDFSLEDLSDLPVLVARLTF